MRPVSRLLRLPHRAPRRFLSSSPPSLHAAVAVPATPPTSPPSTTAFDERTLDPEKLAVLQQARSLASLDFQNARVKGGLLKVGKAFCDTFGIPHPSPRVIRGYHELMKQYSLVTKPQPTEVNIEPLWESKMSCFKREGPIIEKNAELLKRMRNYLVVDLETTTKEGHKRKASPFNKSNRIVYTASAHYADGDDSVPTVEGPFKERGEYQLPSLDGVDVLIGHNIKFDLLYLWDQAELKKFFKRGGMVWDTMYVEYLVNGHRACPLSLDDVAMKYGGTVKDDYIKEQWNKGVETDQIDQDRMVEYARNDIVNTRLIFLRQLELLADGARLPLIRNHMDGLLATTEMEYNGLCLDKLKAEIMMGKVRGEISGLQRTLEEEHCPEPIVEFNKSMEQHRRDNPEEAKSAEFAQITFNWGSVHQLRSLLFGGVVKYSYLEIKTKTLKSGKEVRRSGRSTVEIKFPGLAPESWMEANEGRYGQPTWSVTDDVISSLADLEDHAVSKPMKTMRALKKLRKIASTYLGPFIDLVGEDGLIHHSLNHTVTRTGRLSSANPNMQNVPREDKSAVKECLVSRFPDGVMIESDYSQLEVFVLALLSQDVNLMEELEHGADLHCKRLARVEEKPYDEIVKLCKVDHNPEWQDKRRKAKVFSFQRQYGAGAKQIAASTGLSMDEVNVLIEAEQKAYPSVEGFYKRVTSALEDTAAALNADSGFYDAPSGNRWYFEYQQSQFSRVGRV
eukprot:Sspe_Gene.37938::Locus_18307_Transcript_1_4_Confidence_0.333_Length_2257::g.37938::m.37938/K02335/DPO1, polA; DNA polymerase I